ncbi:MauE/DoxX family redox-associated membrane protein [Corynebacterium riegelii]|uniref:MauE/DoxX family redox-associated membrane protein n=1 Tax=Corynebacterium riegelii TaxID=156976 RepID=UPI00068B44FD|nr:MauE/DoxX family redox-associated membrane protein [Corynebacterium riegelii]
MSVGVDKQKALDVLAALARFGLAAMWIVAGATKLGHHMQVTQSIEAYEIFTPYWSNLLAYVIGPLELAGGLFLLLGIKIRAAGWVSMAVLVMFVIGLWTVHARGMVIDCGCFTPGERRPQPEDVLWAIARDIGFMIATSLMIYRPFKKLAIYP